ncbi:MULTISPECIES: hypothetical protein [unclassified Ruminococcus]|uniref:hypothetical protein n=1 Tax=unclassified Ruminococcus TaxID=2608920 RepID=UPI00210CEE4B|nr:MULTISPECIES: hypothetical protein [unclassified Ruminococcus]MCQ4021944.1 hypothetical protein [Ruminococcus sp. zg-924]MCQ4114480.1 hypothetical protein [Ruminococcus sp. zg-921]
MKRLKKAVALILAVFIIASFAGCASAPQSQSETVKISEFTEKGIKTLCTNLNKEKLVPNEATDMQNEVIGAIAGYRFTVTLDGGNALVEFYEFDKNKLNDSAKKVISEVKEDGTFNMLDIDEVKAELSDNEKYLMIYNDAKSEGDNADAAHKERRDKITKIFDKAE